ncbi:MAG: hypothetical protein GX660_01730 [Clostridiaceae bacterium]|nr:hypothetical protein [Clostridiaceae bacterium]
MQSEMHKAKKSLFIRAFESIANTNIPRKTYIEKVIKNIRDNPSVKDIIILLLYQGSLDFYHSFAANSLN